MKIMRIPLLSIVAIAASVLSGGLVPGATSLRSRDVGPTLL